MLSSDLELVDLDSEHWTNWWSLLWPPGLDRNFGWAIALYDDAGACVRLIRSGQGAVATDGWTGTAPRALATLRRQLGVGALVALHQDALATVLAEADSALSLDDDYVGQWLTIWRAVKRASERGQIRMDPPLLELIPTPKISALQRTFDLLMPDGCSVILYVFDGPDVHSSLIASKDGGDIVFATTHLGISDVVDAKRLARNWRTEHKRVAEVVGDRYDEPWLGLFIERAAFERIVVGPTDQLARELSDQQLLIDPCPAWLRALLSGAAVAGAATRSATALSKLLPSPARRIALGVARQAQDTLRDSKYNPWTVLGFDPIELWLELRTWLVPRHSE